MKKIIVLAILFAPCITVAGDRLILSAAKDNTLYETVDGSVSNGAGAWTFIGLTTQGLRRSIVSFDVSDLDACDSITAVRAIFTIDMAPASSSAGTAGLHLVLQDWGEGTSDAGSPGGQGVASTTDDATWIHSFFNTSSWTNAGGDFMSMASAQAAFNTQSDDVLNFTSTDLLIDDVRGWVNNPSSNYGWVILGDEINLRNSRRLISKDSASKLTPTLIIDYVPGGECIFENGFEPLLR
ncbi:hypothetical protein [Marinicella sp. W31]|uniref:hypothetical protein n=1 Tax=Marinicella sp. W31 TaxID=3023713 RepID=UPI003756AA38